jgi:homoserine kinase type II
VADYTCLDRDALDRLLGAYDLGPLETARPLEGGQANSSYKLKTPKGLFTLSVCDEKGEREIQCLTRVLVFLETQGFAAPRLIPARTGAPFIRYQGKPVYVKEFLPGRITRDLTGPMIEQVGRAMAKLHRIEPPEGVPEAFPYGLSHFDAFTATAVSHPFIPWLKDQKAYIEAELDPSMARGLIHGDMFWDNLVFDGERLKAVLDFEEACRYYLLYDLGMTAVGCCARDGAFDMGRVVCLVRGYQSVSPLSPKERAQYRVFLVYASVAAAFWRFRQYNVRYPDANKKNSYRELADLAGQVRSMDQEEFLKLFSIEALA